MNVLLVDDQLVVLEDIKRRVNWEKMGINNIYLANSAKEAKRLAIEHKIDILITDIEMPVESGILLSGWFKKEFPKVPCVFLTAHADFYYAQNAIRNGGFDYILQPAKTEEIESVIFRCIEYLNRSHEIELLAEKGSYYDEAYVKVLKNLVSKMFEVQSDDSAVMEEWIKEINRKISCQWFLPILITFQEKKYIEIRNDLECALEGKYPFVLAEGKLSGDLYEYKVIICGHGELPQATYPIYIAERLYESLSQKGGKTTIYVGKIETQRLLEIIQLVRKAQWNNVLSKTGVITVKEKRVVLKLREPRKEQWKQWLLKGDGELIRNQVRNLLAYAESENQLSINYIKKIYEVFLDVWVICCYEKKIDGKEWFHDDYSYENFLQAYRTVKTFNEAVEFVVDSFNHLLESEQQIQKVMSINDRIDMVKRYIDENPDKNVTRSEAAGMVYLSEDYFSRLFKNATGYGFKEYVILKKIEYCKRLLKETNYPVGVIAGKIGSDNFSNFSQMFKKYTGKTPQEYRADRKNKECKE